MATPTKEELEELGLELQAAQDNVQKTNPSPPPDLTSSGATHYVNLPPGEKILLLFYGPGLFRAK